MPISSENSPISGPAYSDLAARVLLLGLPKTATTWLSRVFKEYQSLTVFDESAKVERLWLSGDGRSVLIAESVTDPLCLQSTDEREVALQRLAYRLNFTVGLLVLREPEEWVISLYRQYIRRGGTRPFREFLQPTSGVIERRFINYEELLGDVRRATSCRLVVANYADLKRRPEEFVQRITESLGINEEPSALRAAINTASRRGPVNYGLRGAGGRVVRYVNRFRKTRRWNPHGLVAWKKFERFPWHWLAEVGRDLVDDVDREWLRRECARESDWHEWQRAFSQKPVLVYDE